MLRNIYKLLRWFNLLNRLFHIRCCAPAGKRKLRSWLAMAFQIQILAKTEGINYFVKSVSHFHSRPIACPQNSSEFQRSASTISEVHKLKSNDVKFKPFNEERKSNFYGSCHCHIMRSFPVGVAYIMFYFYQVLYLAWWVLSNDFLRLLFKQFVLVYQWLSKSAYSYQSDTAKAKVPKM